MTRFGTSPVQLRELYPRKFYNSESSEAAPAHAALEITAVTLDSNNDPVYTVRKPTASSGHQLIFNGPMAVAAESYGWAADAPSRALVSSSPSINTTVGPGSSSWSLSSSSTGYKTRSAVQSGVAEVVATGGAEQNRILRATVDEGSGVSSGNTFTVDNIEPLCSGLDPSGGSSSFTIEVENARNNYSDNDTVYVIEDAASASGWSDFTSTNSETYRLVRGLVNEASGVTAGTSFTIDNVEALAGGELPVASTGDGVNLEIDNAKAAYSDNEPIIAIYRPSTTNNWNDFTDLDTAGDPQSFNVKLQAAKTKSATSVSVKWTDASLAVIGAAFPAYDPHQEFSSGGSATALGRIKLVTDADTAATRWELTHLEALADYVEATLAEDEGATTTGVAFAISYTAWGPAWHNTSPTGTINIVGLNGQQAGDVVRAVLSNPDAATPEYTAYKVPAPAVPTFDFLVEYGQTLTAGSWDDGAREWTDGSGTVTLLTDNGDGTYDEAGTQAVKWGPNFSVSPPSGKAYRGWGIIKDGVYKAKGVYTCEGVDWTSGE